MSKVFRTPFIDYRVKYSTSRYETTDCILQLYMALFLSKPELYPMMSLATGADEQQDYFFNQYNKFVSNYIELDADISNELKFDMEYYFSSLCDYDVNTLNVTGGQKRTAGGKRQMLAKHHITSNNRKMVVEYFQKKYNMSLSGAVVDSRLFLGHAEPWKKASPELLNLQNWNAVISCAYDDETLTTPFPDNLDKRLIPLNIRNKVFTAWKNKHDKLLEIKIYKMEQEYKKKIDLEDNEESTVNIVNNLTTEDIELEMKRENIRKMIEENNSNLDEDEDW